MNIIYEQNKSSVDYCTMYNFNFFDVLEIDGSIFNFWKWVTYLVVLSDLVLKGCSSVASGILWCQGLATDLHKAMHVLQYFELISQYLTAG